MARPIEPTPILEGKDAEKVLREVNHPRYSAKKERFLNECKEIFRSTKIRGD